jgi:hypothetical protein
MITDDSDLKGFMQHLIKVVVRQNWKNKVYWVKIFLYHSKIKKL